MILPLYINPENKNFIKCNIDKICIAEYECNNYLLLIADVKYLLIPDKNIHKNNILLIEEKINSVTIKNKSKISLNEALKIFKEEL